MNLFTKFVHSYKDLPIYVYHFSTKFRNEPRAKSGILRGREFIMKDLYSAHTSEEDMWNYYNKVREAYLKIFNRMKIDVKVTEAAGGVFTKAHTLEFQALSDMGEDTIYFCDKCDFSYNKEVFEGKVGEKCSECGDGIIKEAKSIEVGNIFPLGTKYAENMGALFTDDKGAQKPLWYASYGIGITRLLGTLVELFHDEKGIIWPENVAPFKVHLVGLDLEDNKVENHAKKVYQQMQDEGVEVLFDDRPDVAAGAKFADADLIGIPWRVVVSKRNGEQLELKKRSEKESEKISFPKLLAKIK